MIKDILGSRLKYYRTKAGLTIYEVGTAVGKSGKTVSAWEKGRAQPDADTLLLLCKLYNIPSFDDLLNYTPAPEEKKSKIQQIYDELPPEGRHSLELFAHALLEDFKKN